MFYPLSWQVYTHGNLKVYVQVWSSQTSLGGAAQGHRDMGRSASTPGSFALTSSLASDHKRFHSQEREQCSQLHPRSPTSSFSLAPH